MEQAVLSLFLSRRPPPPKAQLHLIMAFCIDKGTVPISSAKTRDEADPFAGSININ